VADGASIVLLILSYSSSYRIPMAAVENGGNLGTAQHLHPLAVRDHATERVGRSQDV
jgi:hypothetical protein